LGSTTGQPFVPGAVASGVKPDDRGPISERPVASFVVVGVGRVTDTDPEQPQSISSATTSTAEAEVA
jgi:hypothetical protein